jgi:hypothetical protein
MALNGVWGAKDQIVTHDVDAETGLATRRVLGMSPFNEPEGYFLYARGSRVDGIKHLDEVEYACDLSLEKVEKDGVMVGIRVLGLQFMCPRCSMGLFVPSTHNPGAQINGNGRNITVHWDQMRRAESDGKYRPAVSVEDPIACDYSWHEINGIPQPPSSHVISRCGWRGVLEEGRLYDHDRSTNLILPAG